MANRRDKDKQEARREAAKAWAEKQDRQWEPTCVILPEGVKSWKPDKAKKTYKLDVIPYVVGPYNSDCDEGMEHFVCSYQIHDGLGLEGKSRYCCAAKTFKKKCYVCNWVQREGGKADPELVEKLRRTKTRVLLNVIDVTDGRPKGDPEIQVMDQPFGTSKHPWFGQMLKNKINTLEEYADFANLVGGYTLHCYVEEDTWPGGKGLKITNIEMVLRKYDYGDEVVEQAVCLDKCLIYKGYDELGKIFNQDVDDEEDEDAPKERRRAKAKKADEEDDEEDSVVEPDEEEDEDEDEEEAPPKKSSSKGGKGKGKKEATADDLDLEEGDMVEYQKQECEVVKISPDGTSLTLENDDGEKFRAVSPEEVKVLDKDEEEEDEDEAPPKKGKPKATTKSRKPAADEDEEDEDEDDSAVEPDEGDGEEEEEDDETEDDEEEEEDGSVLEEDEDEDEEDPDLDDDEEEEEETPKKGKGKPPAKKPAPKKAPTKKPGKK